MEKDKGGNTYVFFVFPSVLLAASIGSRIEIIPTMQAVVIMAVGQVGSSVVGRTVVVNASVIVASDAVVAAIVVIVAVVVQSTRDIRVIWYVLIRVVIARMSCQR